MMPKIIQSWKHSFRLCWSFVSKQTLQRSLSRSRRTSALSMARPWKFVRITVAFWERKVILNEQWPFSAVSSSPRCFITEMMPDGVVSVLLYHLSQNFFKKWLLPLDFSFIPVYIDNREGYSVHLILPRNPVKTTIIQAYDEDVRKYVSVRGSTEIIIRTSSLV